MRTLSRILPTGTLKVLARRVLGLEIRFAPSRKYEVSLYEMNAKYTRRLFHFEALLRQVEGVEGRIVECGVGPGRSIFAFSLISEKLGRPREIWGFDTFAGLPAPTGEDGRGNPAQGGLVGVLGGARGGAAEAQRPGSPDHIRQVSFFPGLFDETLPKYDGGPIALLHLDVDLYESYKTALQSLYEYVAPGGVVAFDEYGQAAWPGANAGRGRVRGGARACGWSSRLRGPALCRQAVARTPSRPQGGSRTAPTGRMDVRRDPTGRVGHALGAEAAGSGRAGRLAGVVRQRRRGAPGRRWRRARLLLYKLALSASSGRPLVALDVGTARASRR